MYAQKGEGEMTITGYITNLSEYVNGTLTGEWVQFPITDEEADAILERIGNPEEVFFTDWDGVKLGEFISIDEVNELAEDLEAVDADIVAAIMEADGSDLREAIDRVDAVTFYGGMTIEDVAYELVDEMDLPEFAKTYFDYEAFMRDLKIDSYYEVSNGVVVL